jgi:creatinine amidohydrolase
MPAWGRYTELTPDTLNTIRSSAPVAYLPWGALDWHGPHLPCGVDGIIAEAVTEQVSRRTGGVIFPTTWWPGSTLPPGQQTLAVRNQVVHALWSDLFDTLFVAGWRIVVIISGYYSRDHDLILMDAAEEAIKQHGIMVLALPPLSLIDDSLLDHAGLWETSLMLSLRPGLVDLYALGDDELTPEQSAVQGRDPRGAASPSLGDTVMHLAVERIVTAVIELIKHHDPAPLHALYEQRRERYQAQQGTGNTV